MERLDAENTPESRYTAEQVRAWQSEARARIEREGLEKGLYPEQWGGAGITRPAACRSPPRLAARRLALPGDRGIDLAAVVPTPGRR